MEKLFLAYPDAQINSTNVIVEVIPGIFVMFSQKNEDNDFTSWDNKGNDYTSRLKKAVEDTKIIPHNHEDKLILILNLFKDSFGRIAGFDTKLLEENDIDIPDYDGRSDKIWEYLKHKFAVNVERDLLIYTYGTAFMLEPPNGCQQVFDAKILRGSLANKPQKDGLSYKSLLKLRGTSLKVQEEVRGGTLFQSFMEDLVNCIESKNLHTIAIICRAGHHRSVACAQMLEHLYPKRKVEHLTIEN